MVEEVNMLLEGSPNCHYDILCTTEVPGRVIQGSSLVSLNP